MKDRDKPLWYLQSTKGETPPESAEEAEAAAAAEAEAEAAAAAEAGRADAASDSHDPVWKDASWRDATPTERAAGPRPPAPSEKRSEAPAPPDEPTETGETVAPGETAAPAEEKAAPAKAQLKADLAELLVAAEATETAAPAAKAAAPAAAPAVAPAAARAAAAKPAPAKGKPAAKAEQEGVAAPVAIPPPPLAVQATAPPKPRPAGVPAGLAIPAVGLSLGFGLVLLGAVLPMSQASGRQPLLAVESIATGTAPNTGYWFGLGAVIAGFVAQLIAWPVLGRHGRRGLWALLLIAIGVAQTAGFAVARRSGVATPDNSLIALPPLLGIAGGILTATAGLSLGFVGGARDGLKCRECGVSLVRDSGFCAECGARLKEAAPTRTAVARAWRSGLGRGLLGILAVAAAVAVGAVLVLQTAPQG
jgi:hypothetical protein